MSEILTQGLHLVWEFVLRPMVPVVSLALFLGLFQRWILRSSVANLAQISVGIIMSAIGLILFSLGLRLGLVPLGDMVGQGLTSQAGLGMLIIFALILGYGATVAEPALAAMGMQVENVTAGAFKKRYLVHGVAIGVAIGVTAGILRIAYDISLLVMALPALVVVALLALKTPARYLAIAWDSWGGNNRTNHRSSCIKFRPRYCLWKRRLRHHHAGIPRSDNRNNFSGPYPKLEG